MGLLVWAAVAAVAGTASAQSAGEDGWSTCGTTYCKRELMGSKMQTKIFSHQTNRMELHSRNTEMHRRTKYRHRSKGNDNDKFSGEQWKCYVTPTQECECICEENSQCYSVEHIADDGSSTFIQHCASTSDPAQAAAERAAHLACPSGKYFADTECKSCPFGKYSDVTGDGTAECTLCSPGQYSGVEASACTTCETGRFSEIGAGACTPITKCELGVNYQTHAETLSTDRICTPLMECDPETEYESLQPTLTSNRNCATNGKCAEGHYISQNKTDTMPQQCAEYYPCDFASFYQIADKTNYSNYQCDFLTQCTGEQHQYVPQTQTSDRICKDNRHCDQEYQYETAAPTLTTDRVCTTLTRCDFDTQFEYNAPTAATDRACKAKTVCWPEYYQMAAATPSSDAYCGQIHACPAGETEITAPTPTSRLMPPESTTPPG